jgi:1-acyl-sn-glycerol-3-phosphate acyltransferase
VVDRWVRHNFRLSRATLVGEGLEHIEPGQPYVLLSNHRSLLDIPAVCGTFPGRVRFVAKMELRSVPAFGTAMETAGIVFVDRKNRERAIAQLRAARPLIEGGTSLWIAAEGTRSRDGELGPFKKGGFHTALDLQVPILPTWITGTDDVLPPDTFHSVTGQRVTVAYGPPVPTAGCIRDDLPALMAETRQRMLQLARQSSPTC